MKKRSEGQSVVGDVLEGEERGGGGGGGGGGEGGRGGGEGEGFAKEGGVSFAQQAWKRVRRGNSVSARRWTVQSDRISEEAGRGLPDGIGIKIGMWMWFVLVPVCVLAGVAGGLDLTELHCDTDSFSLVLSACDHLQLSQVDSTTSGGCGSQPRGTGRIINASCMFSRPHADPDTDKERGPGGNTVSHADTGAAWKRTAAKTRGLAPPHHTLRTFGRFVDPMHSKCWTRPNAPGPESGEMQIECCVTERVPRARRKARGRRKVRTVRGRDHSKDLYFTTRLLVLRPTEPSSSSSVSDISTKSWTHQGLCLVQDDHHWQQIWKAGRRSPSRRHSRASITVVVNVSIDAHLSGGGSLTEEAMDWCAAMAASRPRLLDGSRQAMFCCCRVEQDEGRRALISEKGVAGNYSSRLTNTSSDRKNGSKTNQTGEADKSSGHRNEHIKGPPDWLILLVVVLGSHLLGLICEFKCHRRIWNLIRGVFWRTPPSGEGEVAPLAGAVNGGRREAEGRGGGGGGRWGGGGGGGGGGFGEQDAVRLGREQYENRLRSEGRSVGDDYFQSLLEMPSIPPSSSSMQVDIDDVEQTSSYSGNVAWSRTGDGGAGDSPLGFAGPLPSFVAVLSPNPKDLPWLGVKECAFFQSE
ncbi:hypothetical protein CBR_g4124 [Chara braunii]|uniref:Uncharacterized protein n=1 Tax=Chara braunii TaxID=69332 RepID=A0A388KH88_CHABU|nr:hypothetical protein CBR_g4124 [Chara braunii]|eukprot:GBG69430.1 hypothetical protein CBR_g4124 [Chara braunii]